MEYMYKQGFLGTKAPFFMDLTTLIVAFLPFLLAIAIYFAQKRRYKIHTILQTVIYIVSAIVVGYFEYGVRTGEGFKDFLKSTSVSHNYIFLVLTFHIVVATMGYILWTMLLYSALKHKDNLPGNASKKHTKDGKRVFIWMSLTAVSGIWIYLLLFTT